MNSPRTEGDNVRGAFATFVALVLLATPLLFALPASAGSVSASAGAADLSLRVIGPVATDRLGGGMVIGVQAGDALFAVRYGVEGHPNNVAIFAEYKRFLGAADIVDEQGRLLATRGVPVDTILAQTLDRFIEFRQSNASEPFDLGAWNDTVGFLLPRPVNEPVKGLSLFTAWTLSGLTNESAGTTTYVNFTISASDLAYTRVRNGTEQGDGVLNSVAFTFHLRVDEVQRSGEIPWYKVTVSDGTPREILGVEFLYRKAVSGTAAVMAAKYDHSIQGWDFANATDKLALETYLVYGNYVPDRTVDFIRLAFFRDRADDGTTTVANATMGPARPVFYTKDKIYFDDNWTRVGRFEWVSNVTVDGETKTMSFEIQGAARYVYARLGGPRFLGFGIRGAFVYPAGESIVHDPGMNAEMFVPSLSTGFNLTPLSTLLIQVAVIGVAILPALYLRSRVRRRPN